MRRIFAFVLVLSCFISAFGQNNFVLIKKDVLLFNYIGYKIAHQLQIIKFFSVYLSKKRIKKAAAAK